MAMGLAASVMVCACIFDIHLFIHVIMLQTQQDEYQCILCYSAGLRRSEGNRRKSYCAGCVGFQVHQTMVHR